MTNENTDLVDKIIKDPDLTGKEEKELLQQYKTYHDVGIKTERLKKENEARKAMGLPELSSFPERKYVDPTKRHPIE